MCANGFWRKFRTRRGKWEWFSWSWSRSSPARLVLDVIASLVPGTCQVDFVITSLAPTPVTHKYCQYDWWKIHFKGSFTKTFHCLILIFLDTKKVWCFWLEKSKNPINLKVAQNFNAWDLKWQCRMEPQGYYRAFIRLILQHRMKSMSNFRPHAE